MDHMMGALGRRGEGSWRVLIFSRGLARRGGRKAGNDLPDYQHKFSRARRRLVSDRWRTSEWQGRVPNGASRPLSGTSQFGTDRAVGEQRPVDARCIWGEESR